VNKQTALMMTFFLLLAIAGVAYGNGTNNNVGDNNLAVAESSSRAIAGSHSQAKAMGGRATGGAATAVGGEAIAKNGDQQQQQDQANAQELNYNNEQVRQAPGIALLPPPSTAGGLKCFGIAMSQSRSDDAYGGGLGWCWKQQDDWSVERYERLAGLGLFTEAAGAYCSKKVHWRDFGSVEACQAGIHQSLINKSIPEMSSDEYELLIQQRDARYERDMKAMSDMLDEATGLKKGK